MQLTLSRAYAREKEKEEKKDTKKMRITTEKNRDFSMLQRFIRPSLGCRGISPTTPPLCQSQVASRLRMTQADE